MKLITAFFSVACLFILTFVWVAYSDAKGSNSSIEMMTEKSTNKCSVFTTDILLAHSGHGIQKQAADIDPKAARLIGVVGKTIKTHITITPAGHKRFDITNVKAENGKYIRFELEKKKTSDAQIFILHISNIRINPGRYFDKIILTTTSDISPQLTIRVFGIIREQ